VSNASSDTTPSQTEYSLSARRMARHRHRRRNGLRCFTLEIRESEIDLLIARGRLRRDDRSNPAAIKQAIYRFLDDYLR
jgi:hypothetical protein